MTMDILTDVGTVVELFLGGSQDRVDQAVVDDTFLTPPIGVMLTNAVSPAVGGGYTGGYCVVGCSDPMVVRLAASSGTPAASAKLYIQKSAGSAGGATDQAEIDATYAGPCPLGQCMPVGPTGATRLRYMTWEPQPPNGATVQRSIALGITSSTVLVDYASAPVKAGRRYKLEAELQFSGGSVGGIDVAWVASAGLGSAAVCGQIFADTPAVALAAVVTGMGPGTRLGASGHTVGTARVCGILTFTGDGIVSVQASQHVSNGTETDVLTASWFRVTEV